MHDLSIMDRMGCRAAWAAVRLGIMGSMGGNSAEQHDSTRGNSGGQHGQHEQHWHVSAWNRAHSGLTRARNCFARNDRLLRGVFQWKTPLSYR